MSLILLALAVTIASPSIVVTAARTPVALDLSGASISAIDRTTLTAFDLPFAADYLRLVPSVSVASTGPLGAQTQVRIRGAEANQTLTFIDGIKANDPASGGEFRWETLLADGLDKVEVLRGPQSALWGSEAIGGLVNVSTRTPTAGTALFGKAEAGSFGTWNLAGGGNWGTDKGGVTAQAAYLSSDGIDNSAVQGGDKDGFHNFTATAKGIYHPSPDSEVGVVARYMSANTHFDDFDYGTGQSVDAALSSGAEAFAVRGYARLDLFDGRWSQQVEAVLNDTSNTNYDTGAFLNQSDGSIGKLAYQTTGSLQSGDFSHALTGAIEYERQTFTSTDVDPTALSNQDRSRDQTSLIADYRLTYAQVFSASASVRHDINSQYANTTTFRATAALALPQGFRAHASFGEGVSDPSFFDLYGYFPAYFIGNPDLIPETSQGWDAGIGWKSQTFAVDVTWFTTNLTNEIVSTYDFATGLAGVANASGTSERQGLELSATLNPTDWLEIAGTYAYLDATEQQLANGLASRELRRPKNSGSLSAQVAKGAWTASVAAAFIGERYDTDFATFTRVTLPAYTLVTLAGSYRINDAIALTARIENAGDARYEDVVGYRTRGFGAFAGVRLNWGK